MAQQVKNPPAMQETQETWVFKYFSVYLAALGFTCIAQDLPSSLQLVGSSVQFSSVAQSYPTLRDRMAHSTPGLLVHHQLPEPSQTHVHRVNDAISSSVVLFSFCLQSFPGSGYFPMSQFFTSGSQSIGVKLQHQSFQ